MLPGPYVEGTGGGARLLGLGGPAADGGILPGGAGEGARP